MKFDSISLLRFSIQLQYGTPVIIVKYIIIYKRFTIFLRIAYEEDLIKADLSYHLIKIDK